MLQVNEYDDDGDDDLWYKCKLADVYAIRWCELRQ